MGGAARGYCELLAPPISVPPLTRACVLASTRYPARPRMLGIDEHDSARGRSPRHQCGEPSTMRLPVRDAQYHVPAFVGSPAGPPGVCGHARRLARCCSHRVSAITHCTY
ncbi:hypothetical protein OH77DRAFT_1302654 [Trametes cingulata]|nr:hypothetical protein OH77DRAFT_1302654 [Trametes cingulata]